MEQIKKLTTNRGLLLYIVFTVITFGIYPLVAFSLISSEVNKICKDGKNTMPYWIVLFLSPFALGIPLLVWYHRISNRIGNELKRREIDYSFSATTFWGWFILGSLLFGIGPWVFIHKFLKASNKINADYNTRGEIENKNIEIDNSFVSETNAVIPLILGIFSIVLPNVNAGLITIIELICGIIGFVLAKKGLTNCDNSSTNSNVSKLKLAGIISVIGIILAISNILSYLYFAFIFDPYSNF
jgi:hypothetical protein